MEGQIGVRRAARHVVRAARQEVVRVARVEPPDAHQREDGERPCIGGDVGGEPRARAARRGGGRREQRVADAALHRQHDENHLGGHAGPHQRQRLDRQSQPGRGGQAKPRRHGRRLERRDAREEAHHEAQEGGQRRRGEKQKTRDGIEEAGHGRRKKMAARRAGYTQSRRGGVGVSRRGEGESARRPGLALGLAAAASWPRRA